jgi:hypothetical protein
MIGPRAARSTGGDDGGAPPVDAAALTGGLLAGVPVDANELDNSLGDANDAGGDEALEIAALAAVATEAG